MEIADVHTQIRIIQMNFIEEGIAATLVVTTIVILVETLRTQTITIVIIQEEEIAINVINQVNTHALAIVFQLLVILNIMSVVIVDRCTRLVFDIHATVMIVMETASSSLI